jgi:hypothetical protein
MTVSSCLMTKKKDLWDWMMKLEFLVLEDMMISNGYKPCYSKV